MLIAVLDQDTDATTIKTAKYTREIGSMIKNKDMVSFLLNRNSKFTKGCLKTISNKETESSTMQMAQGFREFSNKG